MLRPIQEILANKRYCKFCLREVHCIEHTERWTHTALYVSRSDWFCTPDGIRLNRAEPVDQGVFVPKLEKKYEVH